MDENGKITINGPCRIGGILASNLAAATLSEGGQDPGISKSGRRAGKETDYDGIFE